MDDQRFDELTRALAAGASRRAVLRRLALAAGGGLLGLHGLRRAAAQDDDEHRIDIDVGGGDGDGRAPGGDVTTGDINTGGNSGNTVEVEVVGGEGDVTVTVDGGEATSGTDLDVDASGGEVTVDASGGDGNTVEVNIVEEAPPAAPPAPPPDPCAGVVCGECEACEPATGACAYTEGAACTAEFMGIPIPGTCCPGGIGCGIVIPPIGICMPIPTFP